MLDAYIANLLADAQYANALTNSSVSLLQARAQANSMKAWQGTPQAVSAVRDFTIVCADGYALPARLYRPLTAGDAALPLVLWIHGGGWWRGSIELYDTLLRQICNVSEAIVLSLDYRLAPEHRFPVPLEDVCCALRWAAENAAGLGADPLRIGIAGDSAGGNLAAAACLMARERGEQFVRHQLLLYPATDARCNSASFDVFADGYLLSAQAMRQCWQYYLPEPGAAQSPYASPLLADSLTGLPPATIFTAEYDPLRDEGEAYARRLRSADVRVELARLPGMVHACLHMAGMVPAAAELLTRCGQVLFHALRGDTQ